MSDLKALATGAKRVVAIVLVSVETLIDCCLLLVGIYRFIRRFMRRTSY